jgi:hypothetical protein
MSKFVTTVYEKHTQVYKMRLQKMSQGQRSRGYQRTSELNFRLIRATEHGVKKILSKLYLKSKMGCVQT